MRHNILSLILAVTLATDVVRCMDNSQKKCIEETGAQIPDIASSLNQDEKNVDEKVKCYYACMMKSFKLMRDDGTIDIDEAYKDMQRMSEAAKKELNNCHALRGNSVCDTAFLISSCAINSETLKHQSAD